MKIIILGAGQVGSSVATNLVREKHDITVVDINPQALQALSERCDLRTVHGVASYPSNLDSAGGQDADMIIAVTDSDEFNMMACQIAYTMFHTPTKIARIRNNEYLDLKGSLFRQDVLPIDVIISPELIITQHIHRLIDYPGALQVLDFANGMVQLIAMEIYEGGMLVGEPISDFSKSLPDIDFRVVMLYRKGKPVLPDGDTVMNAGDEVFVIVAEKYAHQLLQAASHREKPVRNIMIAGGGQIGTSLAKRLEKKYRVKLIELDPEQSRVASEKLASTTILHGDSVDEDLLIDENIEKTDVFCALTNSDEANIISSLLAKRLRAKKVLALINQISYVDLVQSDTIDIAISPQQITIGSVLAHVRKGDVVVVHSLRKGAAEAIEAIAHGSRDESHVVGRKVSEIDLPPGTSLGAIVRGENVLIAHSDSVIEEEDHVVLLVSDKKYVSQVEALFQVSVSFL